ncbi:helix-turn-helix domain-containing protein [Microvirga guangxiensis]|uniref:helix-turn-helix domain-containing protein n=1 Tax=Microvirga guangxiensis TaxID=549386 RepID=UPI000B836B59|nr:helix-turn-helix transcriptional regulator [Microvirga guangxiensis]
MITKEQSRAARGLLDWSQGQLGQRANLSESTIRDFEKGRRIPSINNLAAIARAFEAAGIIFIAENGEGPGVRLKKQKPDEDPRSQHLTSSRDT